MIRNGPSTSKHLIASGHGVERLWILIAISLVLFPPEVYSFVPTRYSFPSRQNQHQHQLISSSSSKLHSEANDSQLSSGRPAGVVVLLTVPFAWGTFEPAVRYIYEIQPPVPGLIFSLGYYSVAALALGTIVTIMNNIKVGASNDCGQDTALQGGMELGSYLFVGNGLQVIGLKTIPSDRAAFLLQLTTIFVPILQGLLRGNLNMVPRKTWLACFVALAGVATMGLDGSEANSGPNVLQHLSFSQGDAWIVLAALAYTFHCVRLEKYATESDAAQLAAAKATTETAWSAIALFVVLTSGLFPGTAGEIESFASNPGLVSNPALPSALAAVLWTGLVTVAYTIYAQSFGQSRVNPTDANLIYTMQPLCTAIFAYLLLGETLGPVGCFGGLLIGVAVLLVTTDSG